MSTAAKSKKGEPARGINLQQLREAEAMRKKEREKEKTPEAKKPEASKPEVKLPEPPKPVKDGLPAPPPAPPKPPEAKKPELKLPITISVEEKSEASKPEAKKEELPDDFTGVLSAPPDNERGAGIGRGTKYRAKVFGYPVTKIMRWCWNDNFVKAEIKKALSDLLEIPPQDTTYGLQKSQLKRGGKGAALPVLTDEQKAKLRSYKMVGVENSPANEEASTANKEKE